jgi:hypothetical protein
VRVPEHIDGPQSICSYRTDNELSQLQLHVNKVTVRKVCAVTELITIVLAPTA